jgi:hypothetical protein
MPFTLMAVVSTSPLRVAAFSQSSLPATIRWLTARAIVAISKTGFSYLFLLSPKTYSQSHITSNGLVIPYSGMRNTTQLKT